MPKRKMEYSVDRRSLENVVQSSSFPFPNHVQKLDKTDANGVNTIYNLDGDHKDHHAEQMSPKWRQRRPGISEKLGICYMPPEMAATSGSDVQKPAQAGIYNTT